MKRSLRSRVSRLAVELGIVVVIVGALGFWRTRDHLRGELPAATLAALDGPPVTLWNLSGKPALLVFFAPWCAVCKATAQNVRWASRVAGDGARVISIATSYDDPAAVRAYAADHALPGPVLLDADGRLAAAFGVKAYPTFMFVDDRGRVTSSTVGYTTTLGLLARLWL